MKYSIALELAHVIANNDKDIEKFGNFTFDKLLQNNLLEQILRGISLEPGTFKIDYLLLHETKNIILFYSKTKDGGKVLIEVESNNSLSFNYKKPAGGIYTGKIYGDKMPYIIDYYYYDEETINTLKTAIERNKIKVLNKDKEIIEKYNIGIMPYLSRMGILPDLERNETVTQYEDIQNLINGLHEQNQTINKILQKKNK